MFRKDRAAMMLAFFVEAFKKGHRSGIPRRELISELSAFRDCLSLIVGDDAAAKDADTKSALYRRLSAAKTSNRLEQERVPLLWARKRLEESITGRG